jgi:hypothetical protein
MTNRKIDIRHFLLLSLWIGEHRRPACWFRRLAETIFNAKFTKARPPSPAREPRALPKCCLHAFEALEARGFEPLTSSLQSWRSTN